MNYIDDIEKLEDIIKEYVQFIEEHSEAQKKLDKIEELKDTINLINSQLAEEVTEVASINNSIMDKINKIRHDIEHQDEILSGSINWKPAPNIFETAIMPEISHTSVLFNDPNKEAKKIKKELEKRLSELRFVVPDSNKIRKLEEEKKQAQVELAALVTSNSMEELMNKATAEKKVILETRYNFMNFLNILQPQLLAEASALEYNEQEHENELKSEIEAIDNKINKIRTEDLVSINLEINNMTAFVEKLNNNIAELQNNLTDDDASKEANDSLIKVQLLNEEKLNNLITEKTNLINKIKELEEAKSIILSQERTSNSTSIKKLKDMYELTKTLFNKYQIDLDEVDYYKEELKEQERLFDIASGFITNHQKTKIEIPDSIQIIEDNEPIREDVIGFSNNVGEQVLDENIVKEDDIKYTTAIEETNNNLYDFISTNVKEDMDKLTIESDSSDNKYLMVNDKALKLKNSDNLQMGNLISTEDLAKKIDKALDEYINNSNKNIYVVKAINKLCDKFDLRIKIANLAIKRMNKIVIVKDENRNTRIVSKGTTPFTKEIFNVPINVDLGEMSDKYVSEEEVLSKFNFEEKKAKRKAKKEEIKEKLNDLKEKAKELKEYSEEKLEEYQQDKNKLIM